MSENQNGAQVNDAMDKQSTLKLDYPQTFKVGFAFAIVMVFWTAYDFVVPLLLEHAYGLSNSMRGLIMGLDNLLSLFMLPLFGKLSDKSHGKLVQKFGRRTPFILIGTLVTVALMVFVPLSAKSQMVRAEDLRASYEAQLNDDNFMNARLSEFYVQAEKGNSSYCDLSYLELNGHKKGDDATKEFFLSIRYDAKLKSSSGFLGLGDTTYTYEGVEVQLSDALPGGRTVESVVKNNSNYDKYVSAGMNTWISEQVETQLTYQNPTSLIVYMVILLFVLLAMATFRSPAVALMPDVTPKPLRSQANAIINLCGGVGGALAFVIYTVVLFGSSINNYIIIFGAVAACMLLLLAGLLTFVNERKLVDKCRAICEEYGVEYGEAVDMDGDGSSETQEETIGYLVGDGAYSDVQKAKSYNSEAPISSMLLQEYRPRKFANPLDAFRSKPAAEKAKLTSFFLILASIFMWFMGYNAISSNLSVYITKALNLSAGVASIVSGVSMGVSAIAFIPVGFLAVKIGRRKSIILGFALAVISFVLLFAFVSPNDKAIIPAVTFSLFYLIAGFGLIIANVNTFPMVVELSSARDVGKYTGYYYTATMSAQAITPYIAGVIMDAWGMKYLFVYSAVCVAIAIALMFFVKHGDSKQLPSKKLSKEEKKQVMLDSIGD